MATIARSIAVALLLAASEAPAQAPPQPQPQPGAMAIVDRVRIDTRRQIDFHAAAFPETLYVGQQSTYQLAVFLTSNARSRLRRNPEFIPPELRGLLSYELGAPRRVMPSRAPSYEALVFQRALFPVAAGKLVVPAPQLSYALPQSSSYFSREERFVVRAESAHLVVRPLPDEGRPAGFGGAVGVLRSIARLDTLAARVGDPLVLTIRLSGTGNVKLFPRPPLELDWAGVVAGPERVQVDTSGALVRGVKEFDWILTPTRDGRVTLPPIPYDYFDPYKRAYAVAATLPIDLDVRSGTLAVAEIGESAALMPLRPVESPDGFGAMLARGIPLSGTRAQLAALLLVVALPLPALLLTVVSRRAQKRKPGALASPHAIDALRAGPEAGAIPGDGARRARRALHRALGERLGVPAQELTSRRQLQRLLRRRGVTRAGTDRVLTLLHDLDATGFSSEAASAQSAESFATRVADCCAIVDAEAIALSESVNGATRDVAWATRARRNGGGLMLLVAGTLLFAPRQVVAQSTTPVAAGDGLPLAIAAYERRQFKDAEYRFADLVRSNPGQADLLANWGTAAWAAGDTVHAVVAWQRAARLDPLAADLQEKIALLPAGARGGVASVAMVPVPLLQAFALLFWVAGWLVFTRVALIARRARSVRHASGTSPDGSGQMSGSRSTWLTGVAWICIGLSVTSAGVALWGRAALDPRRLQVVVRPETMRVAPGTDAVALGGVATGDVVARLEEQGGWEQVEHSDGRTGWLPASRLTAVMPTRARAGIVVPVTTPLDAR